MIDESHQYHFFAKRYHWTEEQIDNTSALRLDALRMIAEVEDEVSAARNKPQQGQGAR